MTAPTLSNVSCKYGAPMGRHERASDPGDEKVYVRHVPLNSGGYDRGGAYWGHGQRLFHVTTAKGCFSIFMRACGRNSCIRHLVYEYPGISFYRGSK